MKILVLDDDPFRHKKFKSWFIGHDVIHAYNFSQFKAALLRNNFDYIFLDHDLNDHQAISVDTGEGRELTGLDATKLLVSMNMQRQVKQVIVHSFNPDGAKAMMKLLNDNGFNALRWVFDPRAELKVN